MSWTTSGASSSRPWPASPAGGAAPGDRAAARRGSNSTRGSSGGRRRRRRGGTRADQAVRLVKANPGISASEIATKMKIKPNYLYRVLGELEKEKKLKKDGRAYPRRLTPVRSRPRAGRCAVTLARSRDAATSSGESCTSIVLKSPLDSGSVTECAARYELARPARPRPLGLREPLAPLNRYRPRPSTAAGVATRARAERYPPGAHRTSVGQT